ncbi:hypothetical protein V8E53_006273 [Lactarius tabidus]
MILPRTPEPKLISWLIYKMVSSSLKLHQAELSFALFPRLTHSLALRLSFSPATTPLFTTTAGPPPAILSVRLLPHPMSPLRTTNPWPTFGHWQDLRAHALCSYSHSTPPSPSPCLALPLSARGHPIPPPAVISPPVAISAALPAVPQFRSLSLPHSICLFGTTPSAPSLPTTVGVVESTETEPFRWSEIDPIARKVSGGIVPTVPLKSFTP